MEALCQWFYVKNMLLYTHTCPVTEFAVASHLNTANSCCHHVFLRHFRFQKCLPVNSNDESTLLFTQTCLFVDSSRYGRSAFVLHTPFHLRQFLRVYNHPVAFQYLRTAVWNDDLAAPLYHHNDRILIEARLRDLLTTPAVIWCHQNLF